MTGILDTSFLFALTDRADRNHLRVLEIAQRTNESLVLPAVVLPEICYLISSRLGHYIMCRFVANLITESVPIVNLTPKDLVRAEELLDHYADSQIDFTDSAIVAIAERLTITRIYTLDRRDFSIIRPSHCDYFDLFP